MEDSDTDHNIIMEQTSTQLLPEVHPDGKLSCAKMVSKQRVKLAAAACVFAFVFVFVLVSCAIGIGVYFGEKSHHSSEALEWWKTTVIYQCYPRSFQDSNGDGSGDLNGIKRQISYFSEVGIKAVWLNPIFVSPQRDNGYDISNFTDIDPLYGTLEDLRQLLNELHAQGIHLILDFVPNHTSDEHPWFLESRSSRNASKRNWYVWADGKEAGKPPNNWISVFGGSAWAYDNMTGQYYLHQFSEFQPDLNYSNPEVRIAFENIIKFWLDLGVDGFRIDAVKHILEDPLLRDEARNPYSSGNCTSCYDYLFHNLTTDYPGLHNLIRDWRGILDSYSRPSVERFMVGEAYDPIEVVMKYYGANADEFHFPFNFFLLGNNEWTGNKVAQIISDWLNNMPKGAWPNWVLGNHDNSRIASKAGTHLARALNILLLTLPGTPTTYYGEEILMTDVLIPPGKKQDLYGDRDKERTPMQWSSELHAGFTNVTPWLPLSDNYSEVNVEIESKERTSMFNLYKTLIELRSSHHAFQYLGFDLVLTTTDVLAYCRYYEEEYFMVVINFSKYTTTVSLSNPRQGPTADYEIVVSSHMNRTGTVDLNSVLLQGEEALVINLN